MSSRAPPAGAILGAGLSDAEVDQSGNLAAACAHCNRLKGDSITGRDPITGRAVRLFHPRRDEWDEHFAWSTDYLRALPLSDVGGGTVARLGVNDPILTRQRRLLRQAMAAGAKCLMRIVTEGEVGASELGLPR